MVPPAERRLGGTLVLLFCIALLLVFATRIATVLFLLFIAALLAVYLSATTDAIVRRARRLPRGAALALAVLGSLLVLTGVGALILPPVVQQTQDLIAALQSGQISAAALDVSDPEPINADNPLLKMDNVIITPHMASASPQAVEKLRADAAGLAAMALRGEKLPNIVNGVRP